jgi:3-deoxy-manno-octulosonate cytidylyltransferase (CMP-KDO synthetase)
MGKIIGIIPARWGATRFPGKALALVAGKPLVQHVWERCRQAERLAGVIIATDDPRIAEAAAAFGAQVAMTSPAHPSGTDRIAEVARTLPRNVSHVLNIQGDEPAISPALIDRLAAELRRHQRLQMVTAATALRDPAQVRDPNCVKVALAKNGDALYFSRSVIPHPFGLDVPASPVTYYRHQGIYGYERRFLAKFVGWKPSDYERIEKLEQLRALDHGVRIRVLVTAHASHGVDVPGDVPAAEAQLAEGENAVS